MKRSIRLILAAGFVGAIATVAYAQWGGGDGRGRGGGRWGEYLSGNESLEPLPADRSGVPTWDVDAGFHDDTFTFVRLRFNARERFDTGFRRGGASWKNDWPVGDLNLSWRLQQLTSLKVNPDPVQLDISDERLFDYPLCFMAQPGRMDLSDEDARILRRYLLNGGFIFASDLWGADDQQTWREQMKKVFPEREMVELPLDHPIFHTAFDLRAKPQIPAIQLWYRWQEIGDVDRTWYYDDDPEPHYRAIFDDKGRMMILQCANTDLGDGWQRDGEDEEYFRKFSEKQSYPMVINIILYAMTH